MKRFFFCIFFLIFSFKFLFSYTAQDYVENGLKYFEEEKYFDAIGEFRNAIEFNPYYAKAYESLGKVYFKLEDYNTALEHGLNGLKYANNDLEILLLVADCYRELNENSKAEDLYKKILKLFPADLKALISIAEFYLKNNKLSLAYDYLSKAERIDRNSYLVSIALGNYYLKKDNKEKAEYYYKKAFNLNPYDRVVFLNLANFYMSQNRFNEAVSILESGEKLFGNFYNGTALLSECYIELGKNNNEFYRKAIRKIEWLIENNKKIDKNSLANLYYKLALASETIDKEKSKNSYEKAIELNPLNGLFRYSYEEFAIENIEIDSPLREKLADFHLKKAHEIKLEGDLNLYFFHLKRAITIYPFLVSARMELIEFFEARGDFYNAYEELKKLSKINSSYFVRDKIEKYEWKLKKGEIFDKVEYLPYKGTFLVDSNYYNFDKIFSKIFTYYFQYVDKFKFSVAEYRKNQGISKILERLNDNNENFFVIAKLENKNLLGFYLFDKTGKPLESCFFDFSEGKIETYVSKFNVWLNEKYPSIWRLKEETVRGDYILNAGEKEGLKENQELITFDVVNMDIKIRDSVYIKELKPYYALISFKDEANKKKRMREIGRYAVKSEFITQKHLTKWKRVLGY